MNFERFYVVVVFVLHRSIAFQLHTFEFTNDFFRSVTDQNEVERATIRSAQTIRGKVLTNILSFRTNICNSLRDVKIAFCDQIVRTDYYGFRFDLENYDTNPICTSQTFYVPNVPHTGLNQLTLPMFSCPKITYIDAETNLETYLPFTFSVSRADDHDAAIVFISKTYSAINYPQQYVREIAFDELKRMSRRITKRNTAADENVVCYAIVFKDVVENSVIRYLHAKHTRSIYTKFRRLISSLNLCGLKRSQKIHLCRLVMVEHFGEESIEVENYDDDKCKKRRIRFEYYGRRNVASNNNIHLLHCPPPITLKKASKERKTIFSYLSSNEWHNSVLVFVRKNEKGQAWKPTYRIVNINTILLVEKKRIAQFQLYPSQSERKQVALAKSDQYANFEEHINTTGNTVQMPVTIRQNMQLTQMIQHYITRTFEVIRKHLFIDDIVITFSKIKKTKAIYRRFRKMHWTIDVCQLSKMQRKLLCDDTLAHGAYNFRIDENHKSVNYPCSRRRISLTSREAENLETEIFSMWECPRPLESPYQRFYVGKNHLRDSVFVYSSYDYQKTNKPNQIIYPDGLVIKIDRRSIIEIQN